MRFPFSVLGGASLTLRRNPVIERRQRDRDANAGQRYLSVLSGDGLEDPEGTLPPVGAGQHLILEDLDDVLHALDGL